MTLVTLHSKVNKQNFIETIKTFTAVKKLKEGITGSYQDLKSVSGRHPKFCAKLRKVAVKI